MSVADATPADPVGGLTSVMPLCSAGNGPPSVNAPSVNALPPDCPRLIDVPPVNCPTSSMQ